MKDMMPVYRKKLSEFVSMAIPEEMDVYVLGLCDDTREINESYCFLAYPGLRVDGRDYIDHALDSGAAAVLVEANAHWQGAQLYRGVPLLALDNLREKRALLADNFYQAPSKALQLVGVTGTNGKTSCVRFLQQALQHMQLQSGSIGTLGWGYQEPLSVLSNTTPNIVKLQSILHQFRSSSAEYVVMEVSSHGLVQKRVQGLHFDVAVFLNLSRDHLDFHGSIEEYARAKQLLFKQQDLSLAVINADDDYAEFIRTAVAKNVDVISFGRCKGADVQIVESHISINGVQAKLNVRGCACDLSAPLLGEFAIDNLAAVIAVLVGSGFDLSDVLAAVQKVKAIKGRMQRVENDLGITAIVDFAHTPDGLEKVLLSLKQFDDISAIHCVFGCGGDRDQGKRHLMGAVASRYADKLWITSDNPRTENPQAIIEDILQGVDAKDLYIEEDRREIIARVVSAAKPGECILLAGKGHETYQEVHGVREPFDDVLVLQDEMNKRAAREGSYAG